MNTGGNKMNKTGQSSQLKSTNVLHVGMWACCAVMFLPLMVFFARGGTLSGLSDSAGVLAPILFCLGAHGVMFLFMGKSCHGDRTTSDADAPVSVKAVGLASKGA
jgi:hypothetical protein